MKGIVRRQLSLYLPEPMRTVIDSVRRVMDPIQHSLIPAHVTLCRESEIEAWEPIAMRLRSLGLVEVTLSFGPPRELEDGCILLPATGSTAEYDDLRRSILGPGCASHDAHITILHPRNAVGRRLDLKEAGLSLGIRNVRFVEVSFIEKSGELPWRVVERFG